MTRKQMRDQVVQWLGLQSSEDYDESEIVNDLLYYGTLDLLSRTRCVVRCIHLHTTTGQDVYTLDHSVLALVDVEDGSLRRRRRDESAATGYSLIRADLLRIQPTPSGGEIDVWAVLRPAKMDSDDDSPGTEQFGAIPDEWHDAIVLYALWKASDYADDSRSSDGDRYRLQYEGQDGRGGRLKEIRMQVNKRGTARAPGRRMALRPTPQRSLWVG